MTITLKDRLSHLTYRGACKLLGPDGERLIRQGGKYDFDIGEQVTWGDDTFRLNLGEATVTLSLEPERQRLRGKRSSWPEEKEWRTPAVNS